MFFIKRRARKWLDLNSNIKALSHGGMDAHRMRIRCALVVFTSNAHCFDSHQKRIEFALIEVTSRGGFDCASKPNANIKRWRRKKVT